MRSAMPGSMARPRVLQVISHLGLGGAEEVCLSIVRRLHAHFAFAVFVPRGIQSDSVATRMRSELMQLGVPLHVGSHLSFKHGGVALAAWKLRRVLKRVRPSLVHLHTETPEATYALASIGIGKDRPTLVRTIHNSVYWTPQRWVGRRCELLLSECHIAAVSGAALEAWQTLRAESGAPLSTARFRIIRNGVQVANRRSRGWIPRRRVRLLFAGRLEYQKGADLIPEIVRSVRLPRDCTIELTIIGHGTYEAQLRTFASAPPAGWTIRLCTPVPDLRERLAEFDAVLMPSRFEGLSIIAMEALMANVAVVGTLAAGLREGFPEDYPWLARVDDARHFAAMLTRLLVSREQWPELMSEAFEFANREFTSERMSASYDDLYHEALRGHGRA